MARKLGLIRVINRFRPTISYEQRVHEALVNTVKPGDVVWDVGANVGIYTEQFCEWVGPSGYVVAFEPFAGSCEQIRSRVPDCAWVQIENIALGDADAVGVLTVGDESVQNHISTGTNLVKGNTSTVPVTIASGNSWSERNGHSPNVIKIDVEGFEAEVLDGMSEVLTKPTLRSVLVEVHFSKLELRGKALAPNQMEGLLRNKGFKTSWVDSSHLLAVR